MPLPWLVPDWPAPPQVRAVCTTRAGGVSEPPYDSLNLGDHVADAPAAVAANRQRLAQAMGARPVFLRQVHGQTVLALGATTRDGLNADASFTAEAHTACTIMVADCLPVLLCTADGSVVAAAHAGWRGLAGGILEATLKALQPESPANRAHKATKKIASPVMAWLGPSIGPAAFEVGSEVRHAFMAHDGMADAHFAPLPSGKYLASLPGLARQRLARLGVTAVYGNDGSAAWCTVSNPALFFSHRRDTVVRGGSGRFAAAIWKTA